MNSISETSSSRTNWSAWKSVICGLFFCAPPFAIAAIVFGCFGIKFAKKNNGNGFVPSICGVIEGVIGMSFLGWFVALTLGSASSTQSFTLDFMNHLDKGEIAAARAQCGSGLTHQDVANLAAQMQSMGRFRNVSFTLPMYQSAVDNHGRNRRFSYTLGGTATFDGGSCELDAALVSEDGAYQVHRFVIQR